MVVESFCMFWDRVISTRLGYSHDFDRVVLFIGKYDVEKSLFGEEVLLGIGYSGF